MINFVWYLVYVILHFLGDYETRVIEPNELMDESNVGVITAHKNGKYEEGLKKGSFVVAMAQDKRPYPARIFDVCYYEEAAKEAEAAAREESKVKIHCFSQE